MAVSILDDFPGWSTQFELMLRQEQSRHASGVTRTKDLGDPIWSATWISKQLTPNQMDYWRAVLGDLEHRQESFIAYKTSRCRPIAHPAGVSIPTGMEVGTIQSDNRRFSISNATGLTLSVGDVVQVGDTDLYSIVAGSTNGATITVSPQLWPGTASGDDVSVLKPACQMIIVPGSVQSGTGLNGRGTITFQGIEARE